MLNKNIYKYLSGEKFSNGFIFNLNSISNNFSYRDEALMELAKGKKVLHIGFVDHLPLIDKKIETKRWLHNKLVEVSSLCIGIDINEDGVNYLKSKYRYQNLFSLDITNDDLPEEITSEYFDYIFLPDVIEHIGNPTDFLLDLKSKLFTNVSKCVITTPNAFRLNNFTNAIKGREIINSDHRFWFSPFTLSKILTDAGYNDLNLIFSEHGYLSKRQILKKIILNKIPVFRDTLVISCSLKQ